MPARSPQRSSREPPPRGALDFERVQLRNSRTPAGSALGLDGRQRLAEVRKAEAEADLVENEARRCQAETSESSVRAREAEGRIRLQRLEEDKLAGEIARQSLEDQEIRATVDREEAGALRDLAFTLAPCVALAVICILGAVDASVASGVGPFSGDSWLMLIRQMIGIS